MKKNQQIKQQPKTGVVNEVKHEIETKEIEDNLIAVMDGADEVVARHKMIITLVAQCLEKHKKSHDDVLAEKLYKHFDKELKDG